jgi:hypothetical protein
VDLECRSSRDTIKEVVGVVRLAHEAVSMPPELNRVDPRSDIPRGC